MAGDSLIPKHGGYRNLKSFRVAQLAYDLTVRFCDRFVEKRSRTHDQMVQAARSGVQNIAEGSQASATSKKMELKLTQVARASLEELRLDYEDYLRHRGLPQWPPGHPALLRFKAARCSRLADIQRWVAEERRGENGSARTELGPTRTEPDHPAPSVSVPECPCRSTAAPTQDTLAANAALSLLNLACWLLDRQVASLAAAFEKEGGFTERLYRVRAQYRNHSSLSQSAPPRPFPPSP